MRQLEIIKARLEKATRGPWRWVIDLRHRDIRLDAGSLVVMDFVRYGMQAAQPRFRLPQYGEVLVEMADLAKEHSLIEWPHPDADLIAHATADIAALLDENAALRKWLRDTLAVDDQDIDNVVSRMLAPDIEPS